MRADFRFESHLSVCVLYALTPEAEQWVDDHLPADAMMWGKNGTVIEPRYISVILEGLVADGLTVLS
jgi:hypothetical protein